MKRILLSLAAVAALASCVKENIVAPVEGQLTISAVSADSKTVLDGLNVVWENTDKIAVVVNAETRVTAEFSIDEATIDGSAADFVGTIGSLKNATSAYAVYPETAAELTHTLPDDQTAGVSGLMLSSAALDVDDMKDDAATAKFYPAVSLLQVAVPAGVKSVELTSAGAALVGPATFEVNADGSLAVEPTAEATKTVVLAAETALEVKTYPVVVYPGEVGDLTLKLVGAKGEEFVKTVSNITLAVAEARTINLMQIFQFAPEAIEVAPNGGNFEIPFTTTVEEVTVTENADWLESSVAVKGFQTGNVCLVAAANEGDETRTAEVTVSWGEGKSVSFTVTQDAIFRGFLNDADGNPIQWEETFGVYTSESSATAGDNAESTYKNVFTIAISDDFTKGTYKVTNMFKAALYHNNGMITDKGGEYYANYKDGKFVVLSDNAVMSYGFTTDVTLAYDEVNMAFAAEKPIAAYDYSKNRDRFIGGYAAVVKVEEAPGGNNELDKFVGTWSESFTFKQYSWSTEATYTNDAVVISVEDGKLVATNILRVTPQYGTPSFGTYIGVVSEDGKTVTFSDSDMNKPSHMTFGPVSGFVLTLSDDGSKLSAASALSGAVTNYEAIKAVEVDPFEAFVGTWSESFAFKQYSWSTEATYTNDAVVISVEDGKLVATNILRVTPQYGTPSFGTYIGVVSEDGKTVTFSDSDMNKPSHMTFGPVSGFVLTLSDDGSKLSAASALSGAVTNYVATKQGAVEPEVPADPWEASGVVTLVLDEYMFDDYPQYCALTELKAYADETNLYARLKTTKSSGAARLRFCTADTGEGTETVWYWEKSFYATPLYKSEKVSIDSDFNFSLSYNGTPVALETTIDGDDVYWVMTIPRSAHDHTKNAGSVNIGFLTYNSDGAENGFMPRVWSEMMEVTLP